LRIGAILSHIDIFDGQMDWLSDAVEERIATFTAAVGGALHDFRRSTGTQRS
jgi:hypothetical protein